MGTGGWICFFYGDTFIYSRNFVFNHRRSGGEMVGGYAIPFD